MDKQTLSNYGWVIIVTLVLAVMIALATPFGTFVGDGAVAIFQGYNDASNSAMDEDNIAAKSSEWEAKLANGRTTQTSTLADTAWELPSSSYILICLKVQKKR